MALHFLLEIMKYFIYQYLEEYHGLRFWIRSFRRVYVASRHTRNGLVPWRDLPL
jgi:hypothetical protein